MAKHSVSNKTTYDSCNTYVVVKIVIQSHMRDSLSGSLAWESESLLNRARSVLDETSRSRFSRLLTTIVNLCGSFTREFQCKEFWKDP